MNGHIPFETALTDRLNLMKPSSSSIASCLLASPPKFTAHFLRFFHLITLRMGVPVYLVSGGFTAMIEPLRLQLSLPCNHVIANRLEFQANGSYERFDERAPTARSGGKARALEMLGSLYGYRRMVMIGDGATDAEAKPPAKIFIGYGGVVRREAVAKRADFYAQDWDELSEEIENRLNGKCKVTEQQTSSLGIGTL